MPVIYFLASLCSILAGGGLRMMRRKVSRDEQLRASDSGPRP
jgi:hypothetical protein